MKRIISFASLLIAYSNSFSQVPEDALRYSWFPQNGTARNMAIGGAMGSLGGEFTATFVNPAGLAFYRNSEAVLSLGFDLNRNSAVYRDSSSKNSRDAFRMGPLGILGSAGGFKGKPNSNIVFSLGFNQKASFNNETRYSGLNNFSSFSEQFAEEFVNSGYSIGQVLNTNSPLPYTSAPSLYTYLIDTATIGGTTYVLGAPEYVLDAGQAIRQDMTKRTRGGMCELAFGMGGTVDNKFLWGATLGIPIVDYRSKTTFSEYDTSNNVSNGFKSFTYIDEFETFGAGLDLKVGAIYRPAEYFRIGLALHSPSFISLKDTRRTFVSTNLEDTAGAIVYTEASSSYFTENSSGESRYSQTTPWKGIISASYVFRENQDITKQRAFITADVEYVRHTATRFSSLNEFETSEENAYYKALNRTVKDQYRGAFNFRLGGEIKYKVVMGRLGFAYYGNPYRENSTFRARQMLLSGGVGYRDKGFFLDLTYVHHVTRDFNFPYRLEDRANTFASLKNKQGIIMATAGIKF